MRSHVLLIGIDAYPGAAALRGCVHDIDAIQRVLLARGGVKPEEIVRLAAAGAGGAVPQLAPTLENVRAELARLSGPAVSEGDRVFVHFSGHGTRMRVTGDDGSTFFREALVPLDFAGEAGQTQGRYLFDWEVNEALAAIAGRTRDVTLIVDACSSGGIVRGELDPPGSVGRFLAARESVALRGAGPLHPARATYRGIGAEAGGGAVGDCLIVTACLADERARESARGGGLPHGELTRALVEAVEAAGDGGGALAWRDVWRDVQRAVAAASPGQHPQLWGSLARPVLGGPVAGSPQGGEALRMRDPGAAVERSGDVYTLRAGELHGVTAGSRVAVYEGAPPDAEVGSEAERAARRGLLLVRRAAPIESRCEAIRALTADLSDVTSAAPFALPAGARAKVVRYGAESALRVAVVPSDPAVEAAVKGTFLAELAAPEEAELVLRRRADGAWALTDEVFGAGEAPGAPVLAVVPAERVAARVGDLVAHYRVYATPLRLAKRWNDQPGALAVRLLDCNRMAPITAADAQDPSKLPRERLPEAAPGLGESGVPYALRGGAAAGTGDRFAFVVENRLDVALSVTLLVCQNEGQVTILSKGDLVPGRSRIGVWSKGTLGRRFRAWPPPGAQVGIDRVVVFGTTARGVSFEHLETKDAFLDILAREHDAPRPFKKNPVPADVWTAAVTAYRVEG